MEEILKTLANYYIIFIILALIGIFAIIGYFIEKKHPREAYKEPELDMEAVAKKGGQGLGATLGQNSVSNEEEVEQLDMNVGPATFVNTSTTVENLDMMSNVNQPSNNQDITSVNPTDNSNIAPNTSTNSQPTTEILTAGDNTPTNPGFKSPF
mgnify:FL=1